MSNKTIKQGQSEVDAPLPTQQAKDLEARQQQEELVAPGRFGVTNKQLIPAIKDAISTGDVERLFKLKNRYLYTFANSQRYLKKDERKYIIDHLNKLTGMI